MFNGPIFDDGFPFHITVDVKIKGMDFYFLFKSGSIMKATSPNQKAKDELKKECIDHLGNEKVIEE